MSELLAVGAVVALVLLAGCAGLAGQETKNEPIDNSCTVADSDGSEVVAEYNYETYEDRAPYTDGAELLVVEFRFSECVNAQGYEFFVNGDNDIPRKAGANNVFTDGGVNGGYVAYIIEKDTFEEMVDAEQGDNSYNFEYNESIPVTHPDKFE